DTSRPCRCAIRTGRAAPRDRPAARRSRAGAAHPAACAGSRGRPGAAAAPGFAWRLQAALWSRATLAMPLLDISLVTRTLVSLIDKHVKASSAWSGATLRVVPQPPDKLVGQNTIGLYLYHVGEDAHYKNLPVVENNSLPLRFTPMGLNLYYQLTT